MHVQYNFVRCQTAVYYILMNCHNTMTEKITRRTKKPRKVNGNIGSSMCQSELMNSKLISINVEKSYLQ